MENKVGTVRRNLFVPTRHYHDIEAFNKDLLDQHKEKASENHYKKGILISDLFQEDIKHPALCLVVPFMFVDTHISKQMDMAKSVTMENTITQLGQNTMGNKYWQV